MNSGSAVLAAMEKTYQRERRLHRVISIKVALFLLGYGGCLLALAYRVTPYSLAVLIPMILWLSQYVFTSRLRPRTLLDVAQAYDEKLKSSGRCVALINLAREPGGEGSAKFEFIDQQVRSAFDSSSDELFPAANQNRIDRFLLCLLPLICLVVFICWPRRPYLDQAKPIDELLATTKLPDPLRDSLEELSETIAKHGVSSEAGKAALQSAVESLQQAKADQHQAVTSKESKASNLGGKESSPIPTAKPGTTTVPSPSPSAELNGDQKDKAEASKKEGAESDRDQSMKDGQKKSEATKESGSEDIDVQSSKQTEGKPSENSKHDDKSESNGEGKGKQQEQEKAQSGAAESKGKSDGESEQSKGSNSNSESQQSKSDTSSDKGSSKGQQEESDKGGEGQQGTGSGKGGAGKNSGDGAQSEGSKANKDSGKSAASSGAGKSEDQSAEGKSSDQSDGKGGKESQSGESKSGDAQDHQGVNNQQQGQGAGEKPSDGLEKTGEVLESLQQQNQQASSPSKQAQPENSKQSGQGESGESKMKDAQEKTQQAGDNQSGKDKGNQGEEKPKQDSAGGKQPGEKQKDGQTGNQPGENAKKHGNTGNPGMKGASGDAQESPDATEKTATNTPNASSLPKSGAKKKRLSDKGDEIQDMQLEEAGLEEVVIPGQDEKLNPEFAVPDTALEKGDSTANYKHELKDLKAAEPEVSKGVKRQRVPLEYEGMM